MIITNGLTPPSMKKEILEALAKRGAVYICRGPAERWAPYVDAMLKAGWLEVDEVLDRAEFRITEQGRNELLKLMGPFQTELDSDLYREEHGLPPTWY